MRTKLIPALAGLGLALLLAVTATVGAGAADSVGEESPDPTAVVAASADGAAVTAPQFDAPAPSTEDVDEHRAAPGPTPEEVAAYISGAERASYIAGAERATAERAAAEAAAAEQAAAAEAAAAATIPAAAPGSVEDIIARYFGGQTQKALAVARCESGLNPGAVSPGGGNHGLFQVNNVHSGHFQSITGAPWSARYDAEVNTRFAHWLYSQQGWGPWACA